MRATKITQTFFRFGSSNLKNKSNSPTPAQLAIDEIKKLMKENKYHEALKKLDIAEYNYVELAKTAPFYRGDIIKALRERRVEREDVINSPKDNKSSTDLQLK